MLPRSFWILVSLVATAALAVPGSHAQVVVSPRETAAESPANIVLILADDLGWGDVGFNGRTEWATPFLDALALQGTNFRRFYTAAVACGPSRAALLTGRYSIHNGVRRDNDDLSAAEVTLAEALKERGYATAIFGKWHGGASKRTGGSYVHPMDQGFDEFFGFTDVIHAWEKYPQELWNGRALEPVSGYADDLFTDRALKFLERHRDQPFFLYMPYTSSHFRIEAPADEVALHEGKFVEKDPDKPLNATYAAMVTRLDRNVGRLVGTLDRLGLGRKTLVVFTSDQGATFESGNQGTSDFHDSNRPFRGQKRTLWEGGIRVPTLVRWPGKVPAGSISQGIVPMTDLFPTLLAAAGGQLKPAWKVDGVNQIPNWTGKAMPPDRTLFWEWRGDGANQVAALQGDFKLVRTDDGKSELYQLTLDPAERRDIAAQYPLTVQRLSAQLAQWLATEVSERSP